MWRIALSGFLFFIISLAFTGFSAADVTLKTMTRVDDTIIVDFSEYSAVHGLHPDTVALMAFQDDQWIPVPFQIDQKQPDGSYAFTMGPSASQDPDPNIDADDELIFMVRDSGNQVTEDMLPDGSRAVIELALTDPKNGNKSWLYLISFAAEAPRSEKDYIRLEADEEKHTRYVDTDEYRFGGSTDRIFPDYMACKEVAEGVKGPDVLDRIKIRGKVRLPLGLKVPLKFEEILRCRDIGYIDGPVRVLVNIQGHMELMGGAFKIEMKEKSIIYWYPNYTAAPIRLEVPQGIGMMVEFVEMRGYMDFNPEVYGCSFFTKIHSVDDRIILDGKMNAFEKQLDTKTNINWVMGYGPKGNVTARMMWHPEPPNFGQRLYFKDDGIAKEPPEETPGASSVGFWLDNMDVGKGEPSTVYLYLYTKRFLTPEDAPAILDILDYPLEVKGRQIMRVITDKKHGEEKRKASPKPLIAG